MIKIHAVDRSDVAGQQLYDRWSHEYGRGREPIDFRSPAELVFKVLLRLGSGKMDCLAICDHGAPHVVTLGSEIFAVRENAHAPAVEGRPTPTMHGGRKVNHSWDILTQLHGRFTDVGYVHIHNCQCGRDAALMTEFAKTFGVPVVAHTGWYGADGEMDGEYTLTRPDGSRSSGSTAPTIFTMMADAVTHGRVGA